MDTTFVTFATPSHYRFQDAFYKEYRDVFPIMNYTSGDIETSTFYQENKELFSYKKYYGYFLWKPYIIKRTFVNYPDINNIIYADSNIRFKNLNLLGGIMLALKMRGTFFVKHINQTNKMWTKRDTFVYMNADEQRYWDAHQVWTVLLGFNRSQLSLLDEYLEYCKDVRLVTEEPNTCKLPNLPEFIEHRWEQSVLSILVEKYSIPCMWDTDALKYYDKVYDKELYELKDKIKKSPLERIGDE